MSRYYLTRISIEGFRGINNETDPLVLRFEPTKATSVFAVNATGKTSIYDALCFALLGQVPRLDMLPADQRSAEYYCNRFHKTGVAAVELDVQTDDTGQTATVRVTRNRAGTRTVTSPNHADPQALLRSLAEPFVLLDYQKFSDFIQDTALVRGRTMGPLIGLSAYGKFAKGLEAAAESRTQRTDLGVPTLEALKTSVELAIKGKKAELEAAYEKVAGKKPATEDLIALAAELHAVLLADASLAPHVLNMTLDKIDFAGVTTKLAALEGGKERKELADVVASLEAVDKLVNAADPKAWKTEQDALELLLTERDALLAQTQGDLMQVLLIAARDVVDAPTWQESRTCPLCGSSLEFDVAEHVSKNLSQYEKAAAKVSAIGAAWNSGTWTARLQEVEALPAVSIPVAARLSRNISNAGSEGKIAVVELRSAVAHALNLEDLLAKKKQALATRRADLQAKLPASYVEAATRLSTCKGFLDSAAALAQRQKELTSILVKLRRREQWKKFTATASTTFLEAEAALAKQRLAHIEPEFRAIFADIMKTTTVLPRLERDASGQALSVDLAAFHGESDVSAQALLSESYRNALAISVFLAASKAFSGSARFVVLDDVTSSFDSGHQLYLMEILRTRVQTPAVPDGLQVILLTHDGYVRKYGASTAADNGQAWEHQELTGAAPKGRVKANSENPELAKTRAVSLLGTGDVSQAEDYIRRYLEFKLEQIVKRLRIPVPLELLNRPDRRMVGAWLDAINNGVALHAKAGSLILSKQQAADLDKIHVPALVANWVSHFETGNTMPITPAVLNACLDDVDKLSDCFRYDVVSGGTKRREWYRSLDSQ